MAIRLPRDNARIIDQCREEWRARALAPRQVDKARSAAAVATLFEAAGLAVPPITWVSTPLAGAQAVHRMLHRDNEAWDLPSIGRWSGPEPRLEELRRALHGVHATGLSTVAQAKVGDAVHWPLRRTLEPLRSWLEVEVSRRLQRPRPFHPEVQMPAWPAAWHHAVAVGGSFLETADVAGWDCARRLGVDFGALGPVLEAFVTLADVGYWWPYAELTVLCEGPTELHLDGAGRFHAADRPAIAFGPGFRLYAWHGTMVPRRVVDGRQLSAGRILAETNAELRRMMIERFGLAHFRREARAERVHQDRWGTVWRVPVQGDEPIVTVEVVNSTPEPDGTFSRYELRVPPDVRTALQAVAWTFGMEPREYADRMSRET